jgi:hypothetical protein
MCSGDRHWIAYSDSGVQFFERFKSLGELPKAGGSRQTLRIRQIKSLQNLGPMI